MSTLWRRVLSTVFVLTQAAFVACSATKGPGELDTGISGDDAVSSGHGGGGPAGDVGVGVGVGGSLGTGMGIGCSADMQNIVDENGNVLTKCPPDQGCFGGACIAACDAAAQSKGTIGCDYWAPEPPFWSNGGGTKVDGPCYAVFLANTWGRSATLVFPVFIRAPVSAGRRGNSTRLSS